MKKLVRYTLLVCTLPLLTACWRIVDPNPEPESYYEPVLMSRTQLENSISKKSPQPIVKPGKIYRYGQYILINEQYEGVHLINNQDPRAPQNIGFIQVPGNIDFAVKQNIMYVDNAVDLVAVDLTNMNDIRVGKRIKNALPELLPPDNIITGKPKDAPADAIIVGWKLKEGK